MYTRLYSYVSYDGTDEPQYTHQYSLQRFNFQVLHLL